MDLLDALCAQVFEGSINRGRTGLDKVSFIFGVDHLSTGLRWLEVTLLVEQALKVARLVL